MINRRDLLKSLSAIPLFGILLGWKSARPDADPPVDDSIPTGEGPIWPELSKLNEVTLSNDQDPYLHKIIYHRRLIVKNPRRHGLFTNVG